MLRFFWSLKIMMKTWSRTLLPALLALILPALSMAQISVDVSVNVPPPELPVYDQPPIPADGFIWTPGYWAWDDDVQDYYWVPGTWVPAPQPDYLWTPGYWGVEGAAFLWHAGYWGPQVGFYGGVNYGYGYGGQGYGGGYWQGGHLFYNRSVNNIGSVNVTNVYNKTIINNVTVNRVSYNGGNGIHAQPTAAELAVAHGQHLAPTSNQRQQEQAARSNPSLRVSQNGGHPPIAATSRAGAFTGAGVVRARSTGTMSVVHPNATPRENSAPREQAPRAQPPRQAPQETQRNAPQNGDIQQRNETQPRGREGEPQAEQRRAPEQTQQAHPSAPHPVAHPPEHEENHEPH
jgi:WXXGXW repeat (2 copies)